MRSLNKFFSTNQKLAAGLAFAIALAFASSDASAQLLPNNWTSVRALGMGNAYTSFVADGDALFYNPAGLARVSGLNWTLFDLRVGVNGAEMIALAPELANTDDIVVLMNKLYGHHGWVNAGSKSAIFLPGFAVAAFGNAEVGFSADNPPNPSLNLNYFFDYGVAVGGAFDIVPSIWSVGLAARRINRTGTTLPIGASTLANLDPATLQSELKRRGTGYGLDLGTQFKIPGPVSPSISFVYRDVGSTMFTHDEGAGAPPRIESEMLVGASLEIKGPLITITPAVDFRYLNYPNEQIGKKLNLGVEVDLPLIALRAGLHQGYYTLGVGLDLGILRADLATYGEELGAYPGQQEDRRYVAQLTFEIGFDPTRFLPGFSRGGGADGSGSGTSERRRLKQRR